MAGDVSHFILPHETLVVALDLEATQPHMTLCHRDLPFYYNQAEFKTFWKDSTISGDRCAHHI